MSNAITEQIRDALGKQFKEDADYCAVTPGKKFISARKKGYQKVGELDKRHETLIIMERPNG